MTEVLTFSLCLAKVMQKHHLSLNNLATMIGHRADLKRILADDATHAKRSRIFQILKDSQLFEQNDYEELAYSMEVSRVGIESYRFQTAIQEIITGKPKNENIELTTDRGQTMKDCLAELFQAEKIEILCFNSCFFSLFAVLSPLFEDPERDIVMNHYIRSDSLINPAAEYVAAVMPVLFDRRYASFYRSDLNERKIPSIGGNLLLIRTTKDNAHQEYVFVIPTERMAYELPNATNCRLFAYYSKILQDSSIHILPIKESTPYKLDFTTLCMTFLSHELNHSIYSICADLLFHQIQTEIGMAAYRDKGMLIESEITLHVNRIQSIHEQRHQNLHQKRKPTYMIMTKAGCEHFLETGETTDHFFGFRAFTPEERKAIFEKMIKTACQNQYFIPLLLKDENVSYKYNLVCYDKLGISIKPKDTDYDLSSGYRSVFLLLPEFTKQYLSYYQNTLVAEKSHSRKESLEILETMYLRFLEKHHLSESLTAAPGA